MASPVSAPHQPGISANIPGYDNPVQLSDIHEELARRDVLYFDWWLSGGTIQRPKHLRYISEQISRKLDEGNARIIVAAPTGHGKSELISRATSAWMIWKHPERRVGLLGHEAAFADTWGRKVRDLFIEHRELGVKLDQDKDAAAGEWRTTRGGGMICAGMLGGIMGRRLHLAVIDDPVKNARDAYSPTYQETMRRTYQGTIGNRLEPGASVLVTMQRWPSSDFVTWLMEQVEAGREHWDVILLPAIAEADDPLGRLPGQALWPERYDEEWMEKKRLSLEDPAFWRSQWQQAPPDASTEGLAYQSFSAQHNIKECVYDPRLPLVWSLDFNVDPMCSVIAQVSTNYLTGSKRIGILDEICLENSTIQEATHKFIEKATAWHPGWQLEVIVCGDSGGNQRLHSGGTDYAIAEQILRNDRRFVISMRNPRSNPPVRDRVVTLNNAFLNSSGERRLSIDPKCKELRKDLATMRWKRDVAGNPLNDLDKSDKMRSHMCVVGDTPVFTVRGLRPIRDLVGTTGWVYGWSAELKRISVAKYDVATMTSEDAEVFTVLLDDGSSLTATGNHRLLMRDGSYRLLSDLSSGDSLMPFYWLVENGYLKIRKMQVRGWSDWSWAHRIVGMDVMGKISSYKIHWDHDNKNKLDNDPGNLIFRAVSDHFKKHMQDPGRLERAREVMDRIRPRGDNHQARRPGYWTVERRASAAGEWDEARRAENITVNADTFARFGNPNDRPGVKEKQSAAARLCWCDPAIRASRIAGMRAAGARRTVANNHKVASIEPAGRMPVYCLKTSLGNFATDSLVIGNSDALGYLAWAEMNVHGANVGWH